MTYTVQQYVKSASWWKDVKSFNNKDDAKAFAATVKNSRVVEFQK